VGDGAREEMGRERSGKSLQIISSGTNIWQFTDEYKRGEQEQEQEQEQEEAWYWLTASQYLEMQREEGLADKEKGLADEEESTDDQEGLADEEISVDKEEELTDKEIPVNQFADKPTRK
jgi:hypothetical protein